MTGTVHFDVPDSDHSPARHHHTRPSLLRPVSMEEADNSVNEIHESLPHRAAARLYRQLSTGFNSRTIRCILVVSLLLNLIFAVLLGIFVGFWQSTRVLDSDSARVIAPLPPLTAAKQSLQCFPCPEEGIPGLTVTVRSKNGVCCTADTIPGSETSNRLLEMTRNYMRAICPDPQSNDGGSSGSGRPGTINRESPVAAHLTLDVPKSKEVFRILKPLEQDPYLAWNVNDDAGLAFISDDLRYVNGTITIPTDGRYHVYSHLVFDTTRNRLPQEQKELLIVHTVSRKSSVGGDSTFLLMNRLQIQVRDYKSSDLEGTFELRKGDKILIQISYISYVLDAPGANVFGLFKLF